MEQNISPRQMTYAERFRELMKRMHKPENLERYRNINLTPDNVEGRRIIELCSEFHSPAARMYHGGWEGLPVRENLPELTAQRYLDEIDALLKELQWE